MVKAIPPTSNLVKQGRKTPETNKKKLSIEGYQKAWAKFIKKNPKDPNAWDKFQSQYGTKYDERGHKLKPRKGVSGAWADNLTKQGGSSVELRSNRESVLNFIFGGETTDITKERHAEIKRSGTDATSHHIRGLAEDGPWVDRIVNLLSYPEGSPEHEKGVQMAYTSKRYMAERGLKGRAGTSKENLSQVRSKYKSGGRNDPDSPHLKIHRKLDEQNITAGKASSLDPAARMDHPDDLHLPKKERRRIPTSQGIDGKSTLEVISKLPSEDTDAFTYTTKKDKFGKEYALNQETTYSGRRLNTDVESFYSSWADHIELTDEPRTKADFELRGQTPEKGEFGKAHYLEKRGIPSVDINMDAKGLARNIARIAGASNNPLVNMGGDIVGTVMDGMAFAADPSAQNGIDLALSGGQVVTNLAALGLAAVPVPGARPGAYMLMKVGDNLGKVERLWNMQRESVNLATGKYKKSLSKKQQQTIDEELMPDQIRRNRSINFKKGLW